MANEVPGEHAAEEIIRRLQLLRHPEGGWYREIFRDHSGDRGALTSIYYLLRAGEQSHWHRIDAVEIWHYHAGAAMELSLAEESETVRRLRLGIDLAAGEMPQAVVAARTWQAARPLGDWSLVGCTVAPAFRFEGFELAPPGWSPPAR